MSPKHGDYRTIALTPKAWRELEMERRLHEHPELDPVEDWVEVPNWMLNGRTATETAAATSRQAQG